MHFVHFPMGPSCGPPLWLTVWREFGLYMDDAWKLEWSAEVISWPDFGLPRDPSRAAGQIREAFRRAQDGQHLVVGCRGVWAEQARCWPAWPCWQGSTQSRQLPGSVNTSTRAPWRRMSRKTRFSDSRRTCGNELRKARHDVRAPTNLYSNMVRLSEPRSCRAPGSASSRTPRRH